MVFGLGLFFQSCNNGKTYAEMKEEERDAIKRFIELNDIKVIDEEQFAEQDSTTDVSANEYVLFEETGVYMQVIERGNGDAPVIDLSPENIINRFIDEIKD